MLRSIHETGYILLSSVISKSMSHWEIISSENVELKIIVVWLTVGKTYKEEVLLKLFNWCTFSQNCWHSLVVFWYPNCHLCRICCITKDIVSFESLTLVGCHPAFNTYLIIWPLFHHYSDEFRYFVTSWMIDDVFLLESARFTYLSWSKMNLIFVIRTESCEDGTDSF